MKKLVLVICVMAVSLFFMVGGESLAGVTKYKVPAFRDFSGPYSDVMKWMIPTHKAVFAWWNDTVGKEINVELELKDYDTRMDSSIVASMWPGILADCKPIVVIGMAGADVAALQQRLPNDKVPVIYSTPSYGYGWLPNQWLFHVRPTYVHEWVPALRWFIESHPDKRPVRFGFLTPQIAASLDYSKGMEKYIHDVLEPKGLCKVVAKEFCDMTPVDLSSQVKSLVDAKVDIVLGPITTATVAAYLRACQNYGVNIPTIASPHHTIWPYGQGMKTFEPFEGHVVSAAHVSLTDKTSQAYEFFTKILVGKYGLDEKLWNPYSMMGLNQSLLAVRAVEHAAKKVGATNLTGQAVYDAMFEKPFTHEELMGTLPTLIFTKEAPFSTKDLKVVIETVRNGKYVIATPDWVRAPTDVEKW